MIFAWLRARKSASREPRSGTLDALCNGIAPRAGTTQHEGLSVKHLQRMIEATDTEEKAETTVGHGGHDQLPTKIIPWLSQKVNSKCPIKRTDSLTIAKLVAHGTSPRAGVQRPLRGLSVYRSFFPSSTPSVYRLPPAPAGGGRGTSRAHCGRNGRKAGRNGAKEPAPDQPVTPAGAQRAP